MSRETRLPIVGNGSNHHDEKRDNSIHSTRQFDSPHSLGRFTQVDRLIFLLSRKGDFSVSYRRMFFVSRRVGFASFLEVLHKNGMCLCKQVYNTHSISAQIIILMIQNLKRKEAETAEFANDER